MESDGPALTPANPDWESRCRHSFDQQAVMADFGVALDKVAPGAVSLTMPFCTRLTQHHGFLHAGVITTVLDSACGYAAFTLMPATAEVLTVEFKSNFTAPAQGDSFLFEGHVVQAGRTLMVTRGAAFALANGQKRLVSTIQSTMMVAQDRPDLR